VAAGGPDIGPDPFGQNLGHAALQLRRRRDGDKCLVGHRDAIEPHHVEARALGWLKRGSGLA
jgi:hypothetical protein